MENGNPTVSNDGVNTADPIDRIEAFLAAQDGDDSGNSGDESDDPKSAANPDKPDGDAPGDSQQPLTTAQLAAALGIDEDLIDVDEDGSPVFKNKVDGKEGKAKFADYLKTYQLQGHAENRVREVAAKEAAAERKLQEADQAIAQRFQHADAQMQHLASLTNIAQQELSHDYNSINWGELWQADPGRAGILRDQFQQRSNRIQATLQDIGQRQMQAQQQWQQHQAATVEQQKQRQQARLFELIPDWKDPAVRDREARELVSWLEKSGIDKSEIDLDRAASVYALRRSWQHDTLQKQKPAVENKVRLAPKLVKPGSTPQSDGNSAQLKTFKQQVRSSGGDSTKALAAYLQATGKA